MEGGGNDKSTLPRVANSPADSFYCHSRFRCADDSWQQDVGSLGFHASPGTRSHKSFFADDETDGRNLLDAEPYAVLDLPRSGQEHGDFSCVPCRIDYSGLDSG